MAPSEQKCHLDNEFYENILSEPESDDETSLEDDEFNEEVEEMIHETPKTRFWDEIIEVRRDRIRKKLFEDQYDNSTDEDDI